MIPRRIQAFTDSLRTGATSGFIVGLIMLFLILVGVPLNQNAYGGQLRIGRRNDA